MISFFTQYNINFLYYISCIDILSCIMMGVLGVAQNCRHVHKRTQRTLGYSIRWVGGQWPLYAFLNVDYDALHLHTGLLKNQNFQINLLGGKGFTKKIRWVRFC